VTPSRSSPLLDTPMSANRTIDRPNIMLPASTTGPPPFSLRRPAIIDVPAHVLQRDRTTPRTVLLTEQVPAQPGPSRIDADVAAEFVSAGSIDVLPDDIEPLRERFGDRLGFNGSITKKKADDPDDDAYRL